MLATSIEKVFILQDATQSLYISSKSSHRQHHHIFALVTYKDFSGNPSNIIRFPCRHPCEEYEWYADVKDVQSILNEGSKNNMKGIIF